MSASRDIASCQASARGDQNCHASGVLTAPLPQQALANDNELVVSVDVITFDMHQAGRSLHGAG